MGLRLGELLDHLDFGCQRTDALPVHLMTKKLKGGLTQDTLGCVDLDTMVVQAAEDFAEVVEVLIQVLAGNQDVVQVCVAEWKAAENLVHEALEGLGSIPQSKRHTGELKQAKRCGNGRLGYVCRLHRDLVVCPHKVNLAEDRSTSQ